MRVDVADPLGLDAGPLERRPHHLREPRSPPAPARPCGTRRSRRRSRAPRRRSSHLGARAASSSSSTSTQAPSPITKPALVASNGREARGGCSSSAASPRIAAEAGEDERVHAGLGAAGEHGVRVAATDDLRSLADGVRTGRAGETRRVVRAPDPERDRELAARRVDEHAGEEVRRDPVGAALAHRVAPARRSRSARRSPSRTRSRPASGRTRSSPASATASLAAPSASTTLRSSCRTSLGDASPVAVEVLDLGGHSHREAVGVEGSDEVDPALPGDRGSPGLGARRSRPA